MMKNNKFYFCFYYKICTNCYITLKKNKKSKNYKIKSKYGFLIYNSYTFDKIKME